jgi:rubredoxin
VPDSDKSSIIAHVWINFRGKTPSEKQKMNTYICLICGWVYDEAQGRPEDGIAPGTKWDDVPPNWVCPECGARKEDFEMTQI